MRVVVTGGGTGGHIYPALAVAELLKKDPAVTKLLYIGNATSLESEFVPKAGIDFEAIRFSGMPRKASPRMISWFFELLQATADAKKIMKAANPDVVLGTGGYVSAPVLRAARQLKIPYLIHEPDAHPGLANRALCKNASHISAAFEAARKHFKLPPDSPKFTITGNPIRPEFATPTDPKNALERLGLTHWRPEATTLLVFGGSQGAQSVNKALIDALPTLLNDWGWQVIHLAGAKRFDETRHWLKPELISHPHYWLRPFSSEMPLILAASDLSLCRAGSMTLSEMYATGTPSVLIPYPHAAANHQFKNAEASVTAGASLLIPDADCTGTEIIKTLAPLKDNPVRLAMMSQAAQRLAHPRATEDIIRILKKIAKS